MSDSLWPHGLQHARVSCPSPVPRACSNSRPSSQWCHPTISSSIIPFSSCSQYFPASGSFPVSQFFAIRWPKYWNFSFCISPSNEYSRLISFRIDWFDLLAVRGTLKSLLQYNFSTLCFLYSRTLTSIHDYWKNHEKWKSLSCVQFFVTPWTVAHQAPPSMGFSRQEYWSGFPFPGKGIALTINRPLLTK